MHRPQNWGSKEYHQVSKDERKEFDESMKEVTGRCWKERRKPPIWSRCGFCKIMFSEDARAGVINELVWEERMEHVARHFESGANVRDEDVDPGLEEWVLKEGMIEQTDEESGTYRLVRRAR